MGQIQRSVKLCVIVLGLFSISLLEVGIVKSFGVLVNDIQIDLNASMAFVGLTVGLCYGTIYLLSPVNTPLLRYFSVRQLVMVGGAIASFGLIFTSFTKNGPQLAICLFLSGIGYALVVMPAHLCPLKYFEGTSFERVTSLILTGGGVGMMTIPVVTEKLDSIYGWRNAIFLLGAVNLHIVVTGALLHPVSRPQSEDSRVETVTEPLLSESDAHLKRSTDDDHDVNVCLQLRDRLRNLATSFDLYVLRDYPSIISVLMAIYFFTLTMSAWMVFIIPNAISKGYPPKQAVYIAAIGGTANVLGRLSIGYFSSLKVLSTDSTLCILCIGSAAAFFVNAIANSFGVLAVLAVMNGFAFGAGTTITVYICRLFVPDQRFASALSFVCVGSGLGKITGPFLTGWLYDWTSSYNIPYIVVGALSLVSATFVMVPKICQMCSRSSESV